MAVWLSDTVWMDEYLSQAVRPEGNNATCPYSSEPKKVLCLCYTQGWTFQIFVLGTASSTVMLELHFNTDCHIAALCQGVPPYPVFDTGQWAGRPTNEAIASVGTCMLA